MKFLTALLLATAATAAPAQTLIIHTVSAHAEAGYNNRNPGFGLLLDNGFSAGVYRNSERGTSVYVAHTWTLATYGRFQGAITAGAVTGYARAPVVPLAMPSIRYALTPTTAVRLSAVPTIGKQSGVAHLTLEFKL